MKIMKNFSGNVLEISSDQVAEDWRLGMLREVGRKIAENVYIMRPVPLVGMRMSIDWDATRHCMKAYNATGCEIISVENIDEESRREGDYDEEDTIVTAVTAIVTCSCGEMTDRIGQTTFQSGTAISTLASE